MRDRAGDEVELRLPGGATTFRFDIAAGENAILPFGIDLGGVRLDWATAQPLACVGGTWFFLAPEGMAPVYSIDGETIPAKAGEPFERGGVVIVTLSRRESLGFNVLDIRGTRTAMLCEKPLLWDGRRLAGQAAEEDTESDWEDGERRLREKLEQFLLLYEVTARTGIQTRARKEMEALRAVTDRGCEPEELQETQARLLEEETMLLEKTGEMKKSLRSGRTMDARDGYEGWKLQETGKEENDATICRLEEPEPESGD